MRTIIRETSDPNVKQYTSPDFRFYLIDSKIYLPSVTWILDSYPKGIGFQIFLKQNGENSERIKQEAADKGSKIHNAIAKGISGQKIKITDKFWNETTNKDEELTFDEWRAINWFYEWWKESMPQIIANEIVVYDLKIGVAGTVDLVCQIGNDIWLIDIKTGKSIWPSYKLQVAIYEKLYNKKINKIGILHLGAQNKKHYKLHDVTDEREKALNAFIALKKMWEFEPHPTEPTIEEYPDTINFYDKINNKNSKQENSKHKIRRKRKVVRRVRRKA